MTTLGDDSGSRICRWCVADEADELARESEAERRGAAHLWAVTAPGVR
jgi:hypothetical protein